MQCHAKESTKIALHHLICINTTSAAPLQHKWVYLKAYNYPTGASSKTNLIHYKAFGWKKAPCLKKHGCVGGNWLLQVPRR